MFDLKDWKSRNPLKQWRAENGITQTDAAAMIGVGVQAVQRWESGASMPSAGCLGEIAAIMGAEPDELSVEWSEWRGERKKGL